VYKESAQGKLFANKVHVVGNVTRIANRNTDIAVAMYTSLLVVNPLPSTVVVDYLLKPWSTIPLGEKPLILAAAHKIDVSQHLCGERCGNQRVHGPNIGCCCCCCTAQQCVPHCFSLLYGSDWCNHDLSPAIVHFELAACSRKTE